METITEQSQLKVNTQSIWNKNFLLFVFGWELSQIGDALLRFALPLYVLIHTGSPALMGTVMAFSAVPNIILQPFGGVMADRMSKRKLLGIMNIATAIAILFYVLLQDAFDIVPGVIGLYVIALIFESFITPTTEASVPLLVPKDQLVTANSITFIMTIFSSVGAPILAGFIINRISIEMVLKISILLFFFAAVVLYLARIPYVKQRSKPKLKNVVIADITESLRYITRTNPTLGQIVLVICFIGVSLSPIMTVGLSSLVITYFSLPETTLGIAQGIVVFGGTIGVVMIGILGKKISIHSLKPLVLIASIVMVITGFIFTLVSTSILFYLVVTLFFIIIALLSMIGIVGFSYLGEKTPEELLGKVMATNLSLIALGVAVGNFIYGRLIDYFIKTPGVALLIIGVASVIVGFILKVNKQEE